MAKAKQITKQSTQSAPSQRKASRKPHYRYRRATRRQATIGVVAAVMALAVSLYLINVLPGGGSDSAARATLNAPDYHSLTVAPTTPK